MREEARIARIFVHGSSSPASLSARASTLDELGRMARELLDRPMLPRDGGRNANG
jgi:hypothetical protein